MRNSQVPSLIEELALVEETFGDLLTRQLSSKLRLTDWATFCLLVLPMYAWGYLFTVWKGQKLSPSAASSPI